LVLRPAEMTDSAFLPADALGPGEAVGYSMAVGSPGDRVPNTDELFAVGTPAGGSYSTARDLWSFARARPAPRPVA